MGRTGLARSRGCNTCRQRRIKCDERLPTCERCQKSGYECKGYIREPRFVDEVSRTIRYAQTAAAFPPSRSKAELVHMPKLRSTISPELNLSAFTDDICEAYFISNFPSDPARQISSLRIHAPDMTSLAAQHSVRALSTAFFGRKHRQESMLNQASLSYGQALRYLNNDLQNSEKASTNSKTGWLKHIGGVGRLTELQGPWKHQALPERRLFEASRLVIVIAYLGKGKRCFLERLEWKTIPWALEPASKTALSYLEDILCGLPGLKDDAMSVQNSGLDADQRNLSYQALSRNILPSRQITSMANKMGERSPAFLPRGSSITAS